MFNLKCKKKIEEQICTNLIKIQNGVSKNDLENVFNMNYSKLKMII